jgi:hypothetical protein
VSRGCAWACHKQFWWFRIPNPKRSEKLSGSSGKGHAPEANARIRMEKEVIVCVCEQLEFGSKQGEMAVVSFRMFVGEGAHREQLELGLIDSMSRIAKAWSWYSWKHSYRAYSYG